MVATLVVYPSAGPQRVHVAKFLGKFIIIYVCFQCLRTTSSQLNIWRKLLSGFRRCCVRAVTVTLCSGGWLRVRLIRLRKFARQLGVWYQLHVHQIIIGTNTWTQTASWTAPAPDWATCKKPADELRRRTCWCNLDGYSDMGSICDFRLTIEADGKPCVMSDIQLSKYINYYISCEQLHKWWLSPRTKCYMINLFTMEACTLHAVTNYYSSDFVHV